VRERREGRENAWDALGKAYCFDDPDLRLGLVVLDLMTAIVPDLLAGESRLIAI
jgi:hypothetical protein